MNKLLIGAGIAAVAAITVGGYVLFSAPPARGEYDAFAQCLADAGAVMYGAQWCPHCQDQKNLFGSSFKLIPYVECPQNPEQCLARGIDGYPTWLFADGSRLEGERSLDALAVASGCALRAAPPAVQ